MAPVLKSPEGSDWIYLDHHATTPPDPQVVRSVASVMREVPGNPSSAHEAGERARAVVAEARLAVAKQIGALSGELVFTSGATESNNIAIRGLAEGALRGNNNRRDIVTSKIEHKSVLKAAAAVAEQTGGRHLLASVTETGLVDVEALRDLVGESTLLVSVQAVNNEIGTVQPISDVAEIAHDAGARFHCDASQALGRIGIDVEHWAVDLMSLSAHKAYGPKGVGALYVRGGAAQMPLRQLVWGGGQEDGLRPGTLNVPGIAGFGRACQIIGEVREEEVKRLALLRDHLEKSILDKVPQAQVIGSPQHRVASTTNLRFPGIEAEAMVARLKNVIASTGSACDAGAPEPSHVLLAIGLNREAAYECLRLAVGRFTTDSDTTVAAERIAATAQDMLSVLA